MNNFGPLALTRAFRAGSGSCQRQGGGAVVNMLSMLALGSLLSVLFRFVQSPLTLGGPPRPNDTCSFAVRTSTSLYLPEASAIR